MDSGNIILRPVRDLLGMSFFIPDYQRGYRWEEQQVKDLLSDIEAFICKIKDTPNSSEIYCIQPFFYCAEIFFLKFTVSHVISHIPIVIGKKTLQLDQLFFHA